jgi:hydrophobic/amphiphilic exporter-1 (mainly G- bacteria), HAE1 family
MQESFQAALAALGLAIIFIYLILASPFASLTQLIAIMASLPFSLICVFLALLLASAKAARRKRRWAVRSWVASSRRHC